MRDFIERRAIEEGEYLVKSKTTVRGVAEYFGISKSTVHYDLSRRLKRIDYDLWEQADEILKFNFSERHIRGGESTRKKYEKTKQV